MGASRAISPAREDEANRMLRDRQVVVLICWILAHRIQPQLLLLQRGVRAISQGAVEVSPLMRVKAPLGPNQHTVDIPLRYYRMDLRLLVQ
jgi:hypothetical protein